MERFIWKNGRILPEKEAAMSIYDTGAMQGYIFEMTRSFNKRHFKLKEHIQRLFASAKYLGMKIPYTLEEIMKACWDVSKANIFEDGMEHRLIINASDGPLSIYNEVDGVEMGSYIMIADIPLRWPVRGMGKIFDEGLNLFTPSQQAIPSRILSNRAKHHNRLPFRLANIECAQSGIPNTWAVLLDEHGFLTECTGANIFLIKNDVIYTPKTINILAGISREYVMRELCVNRFGGINILVKEKDLTIYDALNADEMFVTGTPFCILPVTSFNGQQIGDGKPGYITNNLIQTWSHNVGVNIIAQIKEWNTRDPIIEGSTPYQFTKK